MKWVVLVRVQRAWGAAATFTDAKDAAWLSDWLRARGRTVRLLPACRPILA
jgi:hypothetical protein